MNCEICGDPKAVLHHLNGNRKENQKENLIFLCRLCHQKIHVFQQDNPNITDSLIEFKIYKNNLEQKIGSAELKNVALERGKSRQCRIDIGLMLIINEMSKQYGVSKTSISRFLANKIKEHKDLFQFPITIEDL